MAKKSIVNKLIIFNTVCILVFTVIIALLSLRQIHTEFLFESEKVRESLLFEKKFILKSKIDAITEATLSKKGDAEIKAVQELKKATYNVYYKRITG